VLSGLKAGERVVTSGNFLIDSESNLKSAASGMGMPGMSGAAGTEGRPQGPPKKDGAADHSKHPMKPERNSHD
jgi:hypothetical protein